MIQLHVGTCTYIFRFLYLHTAENEWTGFRASSHQITNPSQRPCLHAGGWGQGFNMKSRGPQAFSPQHQPRTKGMYMARPYFQLPPKELPPVTDGPSFFMTVHHPSGDKQKACLRLQACLATLHPSDSSLSVKKKKKLKKILLYHFSENDGGRHQVKEN